MKSLLLLASLLFVTACSSSSSPGLDDSSGEPGSSGTPSASAQLSRPSQVRATVVSGISVKVEWESPEEGARFFRLFEDDSQLDGRIPAEQRETEIDSSYGTHCFRVQAVATDRTLDSERSACADVTLTPSVVGTWEQASAKPGSSSSYTGSGRILVVHSDGKYYTKGTSPMDHGWWTSEPDNRYVFRVCWEADKCEHNGGRLIRHSDQLVITECCAGPTITYRRTS